jgi:hypothetical protein
MNQHGETTALLAAGIMMVISLLIWGIVDGGVVCH